MTIIMRNRDFMFTVFEKGGEFYMTAVAGGVAMYDITLHLPREDVAQFQVDENKAIALAKDLVTRTSAYESRLVQPAIDPA